MVVHLILHSLEAAILITMLQRPSRDNPTGPLVIQSSRIREDLWSALLNYQTRVITISRFGNEKLSRVLNIIFDTGIVATRWV